MHGGVEVRMPGSDEPQYALRQQGIIAGRREVDIMHRGRLIGQVCPAKPLHAYAMVYKGLSGHSQVGLEHSTKSHIWLPPQNLGRDGCETCTALCMLPASSALSACCCFVWHSSWLPLHQVCRAGIYVCTCCTFCATNLILNCKSGWNKTECKCVISKQLRELHTDGHKQDLTEHAESHQHSMSASYQDQRYCCTAYVLTRVLEPGSLEFYIYK